MDIPKRIKIGPFSYSVILTDRIAVEDSNQGQIDYHALEIKLITGTHPARMAILLFHESMHGIVDCNQDTQLEEVAIDRLSQGFLTMLLETPGLLEYLTELRESQKDGFSDAEMAAARVGAVTEKEHRESIT